MELLGSSEISLMPLDDTPFNRAKSDLKFIEAGACRVASLASAVVYRDSIVHGETGLIFSDPEEFHRQFLRLTAIPDLALELGLLDNARRVVLRGCIACWPIRCSPGLRGIEGCGSGGRN